MKDYTKYNFAAIFGAEVTFENDAGDDPFTGIVLGLYKDKPIIMLKTDPVWYGVGEVVAQNPSNIISLTARIKVEDMSVKQLKKLLAEEACSTLVFAEDVVYEHHREDVLKLSLDYIERNYHDYIDCTDWGWKHE